MKIKLVIIILLILINAIELFYLNRLKSINSIQKKSFYIELSNYKYTLDKNYQIKKTVLNDSLIILNDSLITTLSDLNLEKRIFFWHSALSCNSCVDKEIDFINNLKDDKLTKNIIVIANFFSNTQYHRLRRQLNEKISIVNVAHQLFSYNCNSSEHFYFTVDNEMHLTSIFFPKRMSDESKCEYLETMKVQIFQ